ncbi:hypothetical protein R3P38DRAFT_3337142 [Favolaschia claudopus]|uniref:Tyr recombinase domain-containing protein n=1 Tax=Favolaschia claudopus TaxID=2862362 RepID=A0AAV9Z2M9_9AGAR
MGPTRTLRSQKKASSTPATKSAKSGATKSATKASVKKPGPKKTRQSKAVQPAESTAAAQPSSTSLLKHSQQTTDEWYKAARTKNGYANYWTSEGRLDDEISADAFDVIGEHTPLALRALTAYKCEHLERSFASAEGIRSAFKDYFERVCGCQGDFWKYNSHTQKWEGNPVFESGFKTYYESLKNRHNRTGTATQALPMLPVDLKVIMTYLDSDEGAKAFTVTQRLYFKAFASTAFTLWTRNDELMDLRSKTGIPYHEFSLISVKLIKTRPKYMVQLDKLHPEIDCYTHVKAWKVHMEGLLARSLTGNDFVFPALASTGQVKFGEPTSRSAFETLLNDVVEKSDALHGRNGKFTTHCFRRGGAQYRFLWADRKWSLKAVKWWGGWSSNENVGTLMRYLLDELMAYEEGYSDIMMDDRVIDRLRHLLKFEESMVAKIQLLLSESSGARCHRSVRYHTESADFRLTISAIVQRLPPPDCTESDSTPEPLPGASENPPISSSSPLTSRIPSTKSLDDALTYWNHGAPSKDWLTLFKASDYSSEGVKFGNIRFVCEEFYTHCNGDFTLFELEFPGLRQRFTLLMKAVREKRKIRGDTKSRKRTHK